MDFDPNEFDNIAADVSDFQNIDASELNDSANDPSEAMLQLDDDLLDINTYSPSGKKDKIPSRAANVSSPTGTTRKITKQRAYTEEELEDLKYKKQKFQKGQQLMDIIKLEGVSFDIFNLPPRTEFDMYITNMGGKFRQTSVQAPIPEERMSQGINTVRSTLKLSQIQMKELRNCTISIQAPDDIGLFSEATRHLHTVNRYKSEDESNVHTSSTNHQTNSLSLSQFLERVLPVVEEFLQDNKQSKIENKNISSSNSRFNSQSQHQGNWKFSSGYKTFYESSIVSDRQIVDILFHPTNPNEIFICYGTSNDQSLIEDSGLICLWNINQPNIPQKILVAESEIVKFVIVSGKPHLVIAATKDGSIQLWNLKESESLHTFIPFTSSNQNITSRIYKRSPTYSTDWLIDENHRFPIVDLKLIGYNIPYNEDKSNYSSNQIASLDSNGNMNFWIIVELKENIVSDTDFGLSVGGNVKLVRGGTFNIFTGKYISDESQGVRPVQSNTIPDENDDLLNDTFSYSYHSNIITSKKDFSKDSNLLNQKSKLSVYSFDCEPQHPTQFVISSDNGKIIRQGRFASILSPNSYICKGGSGSENVSFTSSVQYSQHSPNCFLASLSNGSIHVFNNTRNTPIFSLSSLTEQQIFRANWHPLLPSVFIALDAKSHLFIVDIMDEKGYNILFQDNVSRALQTSRSQFSKATIFTISPPNPQGVSQIAIGYTNGYVDIHNFSEGILSLPIRELNMKNIAPII